MKKTKKSKSAAPRKNKLEGKKAPSFALEDKDGTIHSLSSLKASYIILFFYPKDNTPGCTIEAKNFTKDLKHFAKIGAEVIGVSGGNAKTKEAFCKKAKLKTLLLSDPDFKISKKFGTFGEKSFMGRKFNGIYRRTFVLNKNKKIIKVFENVTPETHSKEVREFLSTIRE